MEQGGGGKNWETGIDTPMLLCIKQITDENLLYSRGNSALWWLHGKEIQNQGDLCIHMADSLCL